MPFRIDTTLYPVFTGKKSTLLNIWEWVFKKSMCSWGLFYTYYKPTSLGKNSEYQLTQDFTSVMKLWFSDVCNTSIV